MKEKGIKAEDVKNLPPIEEIHGLNSPLIEEIYDLNPLPIEETHGLDNPTQVVKVNSLYRYDKLKSLLLNLLANVWMSLITLWLSKKISMLILVDN